MSSRTCVKAAVVVVVAAAAAVPLRCWRSLAASTRRCYAHPRLRSTSLVVV